MGVKGLMCNLCFDYLASLGWLHCHLHLLGLMKRRCYGICINKLANKYEYNGADSLQCGRKIRVFELQITFRNSECAKMSLRQKVSSHESAKICLCQNFSFYSIFL